MIAAEQTLVTVNELAAHWKVSVPTARNRTKRAGFPLVLDLGPRSKRWPFEEVLQWDKNDRLSSARKRVVTAALPKDDSVTKPLTWRRGDR